MAMVLAVLHQQVAATERGLRLLQALWQQAWPALQLAAQQLQHLLPPRLQQALLPHQLQALPPTQHSQRWRNS